jgi:aspartyl-tRNA(Asn)/glutamyl-tRNA(Gln) amidotransferase subunit A
MPTLPVGRLSGRALDALVTAVRRTPARGLVAGLLRKELGIDALRELPSSMRGWLPFSHAPECARKSHGRSSLDLGVPERDGLPRSARELSQAYARGRTTPEEVARRALARARELSGRVPSLGPLSGYDDARARSAALESQARIANGSARSRLEGVPFTAKEELDIEGFPTRLGTSYRSHAPVAKDALSVARLRRAGAVLIGQTPMTEFGLSPLGGNPHRRMPRNPHDPTRLAGGSSTGAAVAVATGVAPLSLGADAGGSIRVPAAHTGVFGIKPTYGRIPTTGLGEPGVTSVVHLGPLATCSLDLAEFLQISAGADADDPASLAAPPFAPDELYQALGRGVRGLRIGVDRDEWADASPAIRRACNTALEALQADGALVVELETKLLKWAGPIGVLTVGLEALVGLAPVRKKHMDELGLDVQLALAGLESFGPEDYVDAQRLRSALRSELAEILANVDVLAFPTTAIGPLSVTDAEARFGFIDPPGLKATCRYAFLANLSGLPAASAPVGSDDDGMPVGLQIIGDAWDEACVLQVLAALERSGAAKARAPGMVLDLLG